jgi:hypothetical protein
LSVFSRVDPIWDQVSVADICASLFACFTRLQSEMLEPKAKLNRILSQFQTLKRSYVDTWNWVAPLIVKRGAMTALNLPHHSLDRRNHVRRLYQIGLFQRLGERHRRIWRAQTADRRLQLSEQFLANG